MGDGMSVPVLGATQKSLPSMTQRGLVGDGIDDATGIGVDAALGFNCQTLGGVKASEVMT